MQSLYSGEWFTRPTFYDVLGLFGAIQILLDLGRSGHIPVKAIAFGAYAIIFHVLHDVIPRTALLSVAFLTALYASVVASNVVVILA